MIIEVPGIKDERLEETAARQVEETDLWPLLTLLPSLLTLRLALSGHGILCPGRMPQWFRVWAFAFPPH